MKEKRHVTNTRREAEQHPDLTLANMIGHGGASSMIEQQEAQGQQELVQSTTLPSKVNTPKGREALESFGVKFGDYVKGDPLFRDVDLPDGWKKERTDHSMWSKLVDAEGRERASIFYKAAFYDRDAFVQVIHRFSLKRNYDDKDAATYEVVDNATGDKLHEVRRIYSEHPELNNFEAQDKSQSDAGAWLAERYPEWKDCGAYWADA